MLVLIIGLLVYSHFHYGVGWFHFQGQCIMNVEQTVFLNKATKVHMFFPRLSIIILMFALVKVGLGVVV
jgi:hypothetical protein